MLWVVLCIVMGMLLGYVLFGVFVVLVFVEVVKVNLLVVVLIWLMIILMLLKVDFIVMCQLQQYWKGIGVMLFINWVVKLFLMVLLGWLFLCYVFVVWLFVVQIDSYIVGLILLVVVFCIVMVFVWSNLCCGDVNFILSQVVLNDVIMVVVYVLVVVLLFGLLVIIVLWDILLLLVGFYIVVLVLVVVLLWCWIFLCGGEVRLQCVF